MWRCLKKTDYVDLGIVVGFVAVLFYQYIFIGKHLGTPTIVNDLLVLTQPTLSFTGASLVNGDIPLWNLYWFRGMSHSAVPSNVVLYPTTWLFGIFEFHNVYKLIVILHVLLDGVSAYFQRCFTQDGGRL